MEKKEENGREQRTEKGGKKKIKIEVRKNRTRGNTSYRALPLLTPFSNSAIPCALGNSDLKIKPIRNRIRVSYTSMIIVKHSMKTLIPMIE